MSVHDSEGLGESGAACFGHGELALVLAAPDPFFVDQMVHERGGQRPGKVIASLGPVEVDPQNWPAFGQEGLEIDAELFDERLAVRRECRKAILHVDPTSMNEDIVQFGPETSGDVVVAATRVAEPLPRRWTPWRCCFREVDRVHVFEEVCHLTRRHAIGAIPAGGLNTHDTGIDELAEV